MGSFDGWQSASTATEAQGDSDSDGLHDGHGREDGPSDVMADPDEVLCMLRSAPAGTPLTESEQPVDAARTPAPLSQPAALRALAGRLRCLGPDLACVRAVLRSVRWRDASRFEEKSRRVCACSSESQTCAAPTAHASESTTSLKHDASARTTAFRIILRCSMVHLRQRQLCSQQLQVAIGFSLGTCHAYTPNTTHTVMHTATLCSL